MTAYVVIYTTASGTRYKITQSLRRARTWVGREFAPTVYTIASPDGFGPAEAAEIARYGAGALPPSWGVEEVS